MVMNRMILSTIRSIINCIAIAGMLQQAVLLPPPRFDSQCNAPFNVDDIFVFCLKLKSSGRSKRIVKCFNCGMEVRLLSSCHSHVVRAHVVQGHKFTACPFPKEHGGGRAATQAAAAAAAAAAKAARVTTSSADVLDGGMTMVFFPGFMIYARMLVTFCRMSLTLCRSSC